MSALKSLRDRKELKSYYLLYAILGEFEAQLHRPEIAAAHFRQALKQTEIASEQHLLRKRLHECESVSRSGPLVRARKPVPIGRAALSFGACFLASSAIRSLWCPRNECIGVFSSRSDG
jgi:hypothetical protein